MPRAKKSLSPKTAGMEAGASYGEVSENIQAQQNIPLPDNRVSGNSAPGNAAPVNQGPVGPPQLPVESARQFVPAVTPLTAPGTGVVDQIDRAPIKRQMSAMLLSRWADATGDPQLAEAANQLRNIEL